MSQSSSSALIAPGTRDRVYYGWVVLGVAACAMEVVPSVSDPCKACVCSVDDECRTNIVSSVCDQTCWDLIDCTAVKCPDFAQTMDRGCIVANCSEFLAAGMAAMSAGRCVIECADVCSAMN